MNIVILCGRLAHTPELKSLPSGQKTALMSLATNYAYKDRDGNKQEGTDWHNIVAWGKTAETMAQYLKRGDQIILHGSVKTRSWEDKEGKKQYRTEIMVDRFEFGSKNMKRDDRQNDPARDDEGYNQSQQEKTQEKTIEYPEEELNVEDIPF